jgi:hypothetical protein
MRHYRFSVGNSSYKGVGITFTITAKDKRTAVKDAQAAINGWSIGGLDVLAGEANMRVYFGVCVKVTSDNIYDVSREV